MRNTRDLVDLIERANRETDACPCGAHTAVIVRDGVVWLECSTLAAPTGGRVRRWLEGLAPHLREAVVDLPGRALAT